MIEKNIKGKNVLLREGTLDDYIAKECLSSGTYSSRISLDKSDIWLDAGGNIGMFSLLVFDKVSQVISFEPDNENFNLMLENFNRNNVNNVVAFEAALVGDDKESLSFYINVKKNKGTHTVLKKRGRQEVIVSAKNIDRVIDEFGVNKIKMDIEGAEYDILKQMKNLPKIKEIVLEYHFSILNDKDKSKYKEVLSILKSNFKNVEYPEDTRQNWTVMLTANNYE